MRPPLDGTILITGASAGLGREFALQLAPRAKALLLTARRADRLEELRAEIRARRPDLPVVVHAADLAARPAVDELVALAEKEIGAVDVLINNAGFGDYHCFDLADWAKVEQMLDLNVRSLAYLTWKLLPGMVARRRGGVLNVSSGAGLEFVPGFSAYCGTKHFVTGFSETLRLEVRPKGVVVSQLCPGPVDTEFNTVAAFNEKGPPRFVRLDAAECVRWALAAFGRGRALIVPGVWMKIAMLLGAVAPRWIKRLVMAAYVPAVRASQERALLQRHGH
jgi:short-subunit dehydrogenase